MNRVMKIMIRHAEKKSRDVRIIDETRDTCSNGCI